uniref:Uncharacterized protein n=1 Tax=Onchocerca volvulus TaxID=6282 RepID=A0A8R1TSR0_ONCVO
MNLEWQIFYSNEDNNKVKKFHNKSLRLFHPAVNCVRMIKMNEPVLLGIFVAYPDTDNFEMLK